MTNNEEIRGDSDRIKGQPIELVSTYKKININTWG